MKTVKLKVKRDKIMSYFQGYEICFCFQMLLLVTKAMIEIKIDVKVAIYYLFHGVKAQFIAFIRMKIMRKEFSEDNSLKSTVSHGE